MGEVDPILSLDPDYLRQCSDQEAEDFLASLLLDPIPEDGSTDPAPPLVSLHNGF
jgi:hypothetical protein